MKSEKISKVKNIMKSENEMDNESEGMDNGKDK